MCPPPLKEDSANLVKPWPLTWLLSDNPKTHSTFNVLLNRSDQHVLPPMSVPETKKSPASLVFSSYSPTTPPLPSSPQHNAVNGFVFSPKPNDQSPCTRFPLIPRLSPHVVDEACETHKTYTNPSSPLLPHTSHCFSVTRKYPEYVDNALNPMKKPLFNHHLHQPDAWNAYDHSAMSSQRRNTFNSRSSFKKSCTSTVDPFHDYSICLLKTLQNGNANAREANLHFPTSFAGNFCLTSSPTPTPTTCECSFLNTPERNHVCNANESSFHHRERSVKLKQDVMFHDDVAAETQNTRWANASSYLDTRADHQGSSRVQHSAHAMDDPPLSTMYEHHLSTPRASPHFSDQSLTHQHHRDSYYSLMDLYLPSAWLQPSQEECQCFQKKSPESHLHPRTYESLVNQEQCRRNSFTDPMAAQLFRTTEINPSSSSPPPPLNTCQIDKQKHTAYIQELLHVQCLCKPCAFFYNKKKKCSNGDQCEFCHHEDHSKYALKQWKKHQQRFIRQFRRASMPVVSSTSTHVAT